MSARMPRLVSRGKRWLFQVSRRRMALKPGGVRWQTGSFAYDVMGVAAAVNYYRAGSWHP